MAFFINKQWSTFKKRINFIYYNTRKDLQGLCNIINDGIKNAIAMQGVKGIKDLKNKINFYSFFDTSSKTSIGIALTLVFFSGIAYSASPPRAGGSAGAVMASAGGLYNGADMYPAAINSVNNGRGDLPQDYSSTRRDFRRAETVQVSRGWINRGDTRLLAMVIEGEAADEPMTGKVAVGAVIINRMESGKFPRRLNQVVYQPLAFESVMNGQYTRPLSSDSIKAANMAMNGSDPTHGALYFWNPQTARSKWVWQRPVTMQIGRHVFAR
ncbi:spore cortex-lytic enzyme SleB [Desulfocucumis palustris]|uniref:Spore cortex-lytic enzyme SleB n=1 Tax=Desulfocucumis palustris TaxID=1898651 RepID=A0A2L2X8P3_9FIRM|nr:cell wall hydrolase [Desulfocucumis palustris]GBF32380.1 spore cortex-lytic enzyme SleB [Desulfocucumis palustris]